MADKETKDTPVKKKRRRKGTRAVGALLTACALLIILTITVIFLFLHNREETAPETPFPPLAISADGEIVEVTTVPDKADTPAEGNTADTAGATGAGPTEGQNAEGQQAAGNTDNTADNGDAQSPDNSADNGDGQDNGNAQAPDNGNTQSPDNGSTQNPNGNGQNPDKGSTQSPNGGQGSTQTPGGGQVPGQPQTPTVNYGDIENTIANMTLHEKVCQLFIVTPEGLVGNSAGAAVTELGDWSKTCLQNYPVGGVILFAQNMYSMSQVQNLLGTYTRYQQELGQIPLFYAVDEEGGAVARCAKTIGTTAFQPMYNYRDMGTDTAYNNALTIARDIKSVGFNLDFAPVADTWSNPVNTVIGTRAYSDNFQQAADLVGAAVRGFRDGGVYCTVKHFPGHGDTSTDSHYGTAASYKTTDQLDTQEYLAFRSGINNGADMVMVGHITMSNIDNVPASVSYTMITGELRGRLGYDGVVVTDALAMGAVANIWDSATLAVKVLQAGGDILLMPKDLYSAVQGVENAVANGTLTEERINESLRRILALKFS